MRTSALPLVLLVAACASAPTAIYTLSSVSPARALSAGAALSPPLEVGEVSIPATIDRDEIVLAAPGDRLEVSPNSIWGAPVRQLIRRALSDDLLARLPPGSVLPPGAPAPKDGLSILTVSIEQFGGDTSGHVGLIAAWILAPSGSPPSGAPHRASIELDAGSGDAASVVPAMSQALGLLAGKIAASL